MKLIAILLILAGCSAASNGPPRLDVSCVIESQVPGVTTISCADPQSWKEYYAEQLRQRQF